MNYTDLAKERLKKYIPKHKATFRGIPVSKFNREELLKIIDMYAVLIRNKDETIDLLSRD